MGRVKGVAHDLIRRFGVDVVRYPPPDFDDATLATIRAVRPYTLTSPERVNALCQAVRYLVDANIDGSIVECGVWRGGSVMAVARTLLESGGAAREIWLYDTFSGMTQPGPRDRFFTGRTAADLLSREDPHGLSVPWCRAGVDEVREALSQIAYPAELFRFVEGPVEETLPHHMPERISLLRLDTDWYESTRHELIHLFPLLEPGGVLLIDDYGAWEGARYAVDEFMKDRNLHFMLSRIDASGRMAIVPG
jgi:hypothetical protein